MEDSGKLGDRQSFLGGKNIVLPKCPHLQPTLGYDSIEVLKHNDVVDIAF